MQNAQERIPRYARNDIHAGFVIARSPKGDVAIRLLFWLMPSAYLSFLPEISISFKLDEL